LAGEQPVFKRDGSRASGSRVSWDNSGLSIATAFEFGRRAQLLLRPRITQIGDSLPASGAHFGTHAALDTGRPKIGRILRPSGVFCGYEYFVLQTPLWEPEAEWERVLARKRELRARLGLDEGRRVWPVSLERLEESGAFRYTRELVLHSVERGDGDRLVGLALSEGSMTTLLGAGVTEQDVGLDRLRALAENMDRSFPWWIGYRAWIGLK
jgi:hypothetical protein